MVNMKPLKDINIST